MCASKHFFIWTFVLGGSYAAILPAATVYQCKDARGVTVFSQSPCGNDAKKLSMDSQSPYEKDQGPAIAHAEAARKLEMKFFDLCKSEYGDVNVACMRRQREALEEMMPIAKGEESSPKTIKARNCFAKWELPEQKLVNAEMWRYCYYH